MSALLSGSVTFLACKKNSVGQKLREFRMRCRNTKYFKKEDVLFVGIVFENDLICVIGMHAEIRQLYTIRLE